MPLRGHAVVACILLANLRMPSTRRRTLLALIVVGLLQTAAPTRAQSDLPAPPHLRPDPGLRALVERAAARSPSIQSAIARIEAADVIVYVRTRAFLEPGLEGRVGLIAVVNGRRFLAIELACNRTELATMATLAHELHHALEISGEPAIVDTRTLAGFYTIHGIRTDDRPGHLTFETDGAEQAGRVARREITASRERQTWNSK